MVSRQYNETLLQGCMGFHGASGVVASGYDCLKNADDASLLPAVRDGNASALDVLVRRHFALVKYLAGKCAGGAEFDDLVQEGVIGLLQAIRRFDPQKGSSFPTFATLCIQRRMWTLVKSETAKNLSLNARPEDFYQSRGGVPDENFLHEGSLPEDYVIRREENQERLSRLQALLSDFEWQTLQLYLRGCSYDQMAVRLQCTTKAVDNALFRARRKLRLAV